MPSLWLVDGSGFGINFGCNDSNVALFVPTYCALNVIAVEVLIYAWQTACHFAKGANVRRGALNLSNCPFQLYISLDKNNRQEAVGIESIWIGNYNLSSSPGQLPLSQTSMTSISPQIEAIHSGDAHSYHVRSHVPLQIFSLCRLPLQCWHFRTQQSFR